MNTPIDKIIRALESIDNPNPKDLDGLQELKSIQELEAEYVAFSEKSKDLRFNLGRWLPSLGKQMRSLVPGEIMAILAGTGIGKTAILQNLALAAAPIETILFEIELPGTLTFERFVSLQTQTPANVVETTYLQGMRMNWSHDRFSHIHVCTNSKLSVNDLERIILTAHHKTRKRPALVLLDYIGLVQGKGFNRYERMSMVMEEIKRIAKSTNTIIVIASQISRKKGEDDKEVTLEDGKDSGSVENSSGAVLGVWREGEGGRLMKVKVLKQTKGRAGHVAHCEFRGDCSLITEVPKPEGAKPDWSPEDL